MVTTPIVHLEQLACEAVTLEEVEEDVQKKVLSVSEMEKEKVMVIKVWREWKDQVKCMLIHKSKLSFLQ